MVQVVKVVVVGNGTVAAPLPVEVIVFGQMEEHRAAYAPNLSAGMRCMLRRMFPRGHASSP